MQNETVPQLGEIHARLNSERVDADDTPNSHNDDGEERLNIIYVNESADEDSIVAIIEGAVIREASSQESLGYTEDINLDQTMAAPIIEQNQQASEQEAQQEIEQAEQLLLDALNFWRMQERVDADDRPDDFDGDDDENHDDDGEERLNIICK
jgi:hypothetical protein